MWLEIEAKVDSVIVNYVTKYAPYIYYLLQPILCFFWESKPQYLMKITRFSV